MDEEEFYEEDINPMYDPDYCYECTGYGDDTYEDENGELQIRCFECPYSLTASEED